MKKKSLNFKVITSLCILLSLLFSCSSKDVPTPNDNTSACIVEFNYDHNLLFTNIFPDDIKTISLWVFDLDGNLIYFAHEKEISKGFYMKIPLPPGMYNIVAWCGLSEENPLKLINKTPKDITESSLDLTLSSDGTGYYFNSEIPATFNGFLENVEISEKSIKRLKMNLTKVSKNIRIMIHDYSNSIDLNSYSVYITKSANYLTWKDLPLSNKSFMLYPFKTTMGTVQNSDKTNDLENVVILDFSILNLITTGNQRLIVLRNSDNIEVYNMSLIELILQTKNTSIYDLDDQEYLDRQDLYRISISSIN